MNTITAPDTNNAPRKSGRPRALPGKRVYVLKVGAKQRSGERKKDWTCIYVSASQWTKFLALTGSDESAITSAMRDGAKTLSPAQVNVSAAARDKALKSLQAAYAEEGAIAAANNSAWEYRDVEDAR